MNDREKLIELIGLTEYGNGALVGKNFQRGFIGKIADHLIANGVTVQQWVPVRGGFQVKMNIVSCIMYTHIATMMVIGQSAHPFLMAINSKSGLHTKSPIGCLCRCRRKENEDEKLRYYGIHRN